jgi:RNA polymerase sigma-70 factor (ECF subfamily)
MNHQSGPSDQELIAAVLAGDQQAFGTLVFRYQDRLFNGIARLVRCESLAADVVQDAFVLAWRKLDSFGGRSAFYTWLFRIARNQAVSRLRSMKPTVSLDGLMEAGASGFDAESAPPDAGMEREESLMQLELAMEQLSDDHRAIIVLREIEEMDYEQIAECLELPVGTVRSRLFRARMQLREELRKVVGTGE